MIRWRTVLIIGLIVIIPIAIVVALWGPSSQSGSRFPFLIFSNGTKSEASGSGVQSAVKILKPARGESFELYEMIEFEWCWYKTLRSTSDKFVIYLTAAHHEQISTTSPEPDGENCYRFVTNGYDIASLPGEYELQMKIQKEPSNIVLGLSDSRKIVFLLDGSLITPIPTNTRTPTAMATSTPIKTLTPSQTPTVQPTKTPKPTSTPTNTPEFVPTVTPLPTQIPPSPTNTQPPPPPPPPKPTSVPPTATAPPPPPPPKPTNPPPRATPTPP